MRLCNDALWEGQENRVASLPVDDSYDLKFYFDTERASIQNLSFFKGLFILDVDECSICTCAFMPEEDIISR